MLPAHYSNKGEARYFCRFTFGQFFTILVLEIFTLFFIFYLGARYGRELFGLPSSSPAIAQKQKGMPEVTNTMETVVSTTHDPEIKALTKEIMNSAPTSDLKQRVEDMLKTTDHGPSRNSPSSIVHSPKPPEEKPEVAVQEKPQPVIATAPANARYSIQVGSYPNPDEAHEVVNNWKEKGYEAYLLSADIPDKGRWYRVRLGAFDTKEEAQKYLTQFQTKEGVEAFVTANQ